MLYYTGIGVESPMDNDVMVIMKVAGHMREAGYRLRTGRAPGADSAFEYGAQGQADIYLPWRSYGRGNQPVLAKSAPINTTVPKIGENEKATRLLIDVHKFLTGEPTVDQDSAVSKMVYRYIVAILGRKGEDISKVLLYVSYSDRTLPKGDPLTFVLQTAELLGLPAINIAQMGSTEAIAAAGEAVNFVSGTRV